MICQRLGTIPVPTWVGFLPACWRLPTLKLQLYETVLPMRFVLHAQLLVLLGCFLLQGRADGVPRAAEPKDARENAANDAPPRTAPVKRPVQRDTSGPRLLGLGPGDEVRIIFSSTGCFHNTRFELLFAGSSPQLVQIWKLDTKGEQKQREEMGAVSLYRNDWKRLSKAIAYYRSGRKSGTSTTTDDISISWSKKDKQAQQEHFTDTSGTRGDVFNNLITRAANNKQPQGPAAPGQPR